VKLDHLLVLHVLIGVFGAHHIGAVLLVVAWSLGLVMRKLPSAIWMPLMLAVRSPTLTLSRVEMK